MPTLSFSQVQAAMQAMIARATQLPDEPVAMAIVDPTGNLLAYAAMDNLRLFSRRHALRKAYTAAIMGIDSGAHAQRLQSQGRSIAELGDPQLTFGQGGLVIMQGGVILGGIGVSSVTRVFVQQKVRSIAILKCVGSTTHQVLSIYLTQVLLLGVAGSALGVGHRHEIHAIKQRTQFAGNGNHNILVW